MSLKPNIIKYRGFIIKKLVENYRVTYRVEGSSMPLISVKAAMNVIDTYKRKDQRKEKENDDPGNFNND